MNTVQNTVTTASQTAARCRSAWIAAETRRAAAQTALLDADRQATDAWHAYAEALASASRSRSHDTARPDRRQDDAHS